MMSNMTATSFASVAHPLWHGGCIRYFLDKQDQSSLCTEAGWVLPERRLGGFWLAFN